LFVWKTAALDDVNHFHLCTGMAADVGTLQRLPRVIGSESLVRELAFTARKMMASEAKECGFVSKVYDDKDR
jgi:delta(3,5)-delta(2,4)-dienoyl-CoA isomerase